MFDYKSKLVRKIRNVISINKILDEESEINSHKKK